MHRIFIPGQCPHIDDENGWKEYKKAISEQIEQMGGKVNRTYGIKKLREVYSELRAKKKLEGKK